MDIILGPKPPPEPQKLPPIQYEKTVKLASSDGRIEAPFSSPPGKTRIQPIPPSETRIQPIPAGRGPIIEQSQHNILRYYANPYRNDRGYSISYPEKFRMPETLGSPIKEVNIQSLQTGMPDGSRLFSAADISNVFRRRQCTFEMPAQIKDSRPGDPVALYRRQGENFNQFEFTGHISNIHHGPSGDYVRFTIQIKSQYVAVLFNKDLFVQIFGFIPHTVTEEDKLLSLAEQYDTSPEDIYDANRYDGNPFAPEQLIRIPRPVNPDLEGFYARFHIVPR